jgi:hypothetical protein
MHPIVLIPIALVALVVWAFLSLQKSAKGVYDKLDSLKARAEAATTVEELNVIANELCTFANAECWHHSFGAAAQAVLTYIQGKRAGLQASNRSP